MWSIAKTNWQATDFENVEDLNRQKNNLIYVIQEVLPKLGYSNLPVTALPDWEENDNVFFNELQEIEMMVAAIPQEFRPAVPREWSSQMLNNSISYEDFNRWEQTADTVYKLYVGITAALRHSGTFNSGMGGLRT